MMYHYDLHIHSVLSPCADCLMTPNNILNMAMLKGLDMISITDHNSLKQLPVIYELAKSYDFLLIPGVEVTLNTKEHLLIYFKTLEDAMRFDPVLDQYRPSVKNNYGLASITDMEDFVIESYPYISSEPLNLDYQGLMNILKPYEYRIVLAHIDRPDSNIIERLDHYQFNGIELTSCDKLKITQYGLSHYSIFYNSDAHDLLQISEAKKHNTIDLESLSIDAFFRCLQNE